MSIPHLLTSFNRTEPFCEPSVVLSLEFIFIHLLKTILIESLEYAVEANRVSHSFNYTSVKRADPDRVAIYIRVRLSLSLIYKTSVFLAVIMLIRCGQYKTA